jgi:hypothetical protein
MKEELYLAVHVLCRGGSMQGITIGSFLTITTIIILIVVFSIEGRGCVVTFDHGWWAGIKGWFGIHKDGRLTFED